LVRNVLHDAGQEGYNVAGFSGGEPTMYPWLIEALVAAHESGLRTTVTSHGMLLSDRFLGRLRGHLDLLAISLDGLPDSHNRMRRADNAFQVMHRHLPAVRESGVPFGFIFTLTQHNLYELDWVAQFAVEHGAGLLQIHPLEETGRAERELSGGEPDEIEASVAFLEVSRLQQKYGKAIHLQLDLLDRRFIAAHPERVLAKPVGDGAAQRLSALISPLIVEPDGTVVPIQYGFDRRFAFGNLHDRSLRTLAAAWRREKMQQFFAICRQAYDDLMQPSELPFVNWYPLLTRVTSADVNGDCSDVRR
jgi:MoaA/NifB/PqqE/SkfB family radical SAM enzyme